MRTQTPQIIITDQDAAIAKAISMVLPFTFHRYCLWHILNRFSEKINVIVHNDDYHMLVNIIKYSKSPDEFEECWAGLMENRDFADNEWLCSMYAIRSRWVPAYVNHIFSARMSSSQRSESSHSFFKSFLRKKQVLLLPEKYILRRWTKNAKLSCSHEPTSGLSTDDSSRTSLMARHDLLAHKASLIVDDASLTASRSTFLMGKFECLHLLVKEIDDGDNIGSMRHNSTTREKRHTIHDPSADPRATSCYVSFFWYLWKPRGLFNHVDEAENRSNADTKIWGEDENVGTQFDGRDDGTFTSQASSHYDVVNWFL
ncbi:Protein FAR1-RELATED SEQUENCE [Abeliophyllum distichum]|uniref:Protein FAR1-RELATED SEQUENCE n=1 Tax=Abeliophyllum distichum TaxID=126358 RepID=A0ABD1UEP5_9LAMI